MGSQPGPARASAQGLLREDLFTVVIEQFPTDTVDYADIVLPATMQTEHLDVNDGYGHLRAPQPPGGRAARRVPARRLETFRRLARGDGARRARAVRRPTRTLARTLLGDDRLRRSLYEHGWMRLTCPTPFVPFTDGFPTPSGKLEFFSRDGASATASTRSPATRRRRRRDRRRAPARADRPRLALVPEHDLRQQAGPDEARPAARGSSCTPTTPPQRGLATGDTRARLQRPRRASTRDGRGQRPRPARRDRLDQGPLAQARARRRERQRHRRGARRRHGRRRDLPRQPRRGRAG